MTGFADGILVGYDGSRCSEQALTWAARDAISRHLPLTVCHAWTTGFTVPRHKSMVLALARECGERVLADGVGRAQELMRSLPVRPLLIEGPAAAVLSQASRSADLVVVGSQGRGGVAGQFLGSVSWQVAACSACPVVVVRGHWRPAAGYRPGPIVVGADGSAASRAAVGFAFEQAALRDTAVLAVCALADAPGSLAGTRDLQDEFHLAVDEAEKASPGTAVVRQVAIGGARAELLRAAQNAQLLVVGSRGRGGIHGMLLGSVSQALICHAPCPVAVVHPR
ncbi:MAG TPA: universal stress protein [Streptosporangiaceae bacterium]|nr:universal stress protein [Streptosporangiaceae bacterium]